MLELALGAGGLLLLIWAVYPVVVHGVAALRRPSGAPGTVDPHNWPDVTVVVATREDAGLVNARVRDALAADYPADRLSVVVALDHEARTEPAEIDAAGGRVVVVRGEAPGGKAAALNAGVEAAAGEILVFSDTHQRFDPGALRLLVRMLEGNRFGAVSGQLELADAGRRSLVEQYWRFERRLRRDEARIHSAIGVSGSIYAMRRALWSPLPAGLILDDLYVPMRLILDGYRVGFTEAAKAFDSRRTRAGQEFRRKVRTLTGNFQLCAWLPAMLLPWRNPVWPQFMLHKVLRLLTPWLVIAFVIGVVGLMLSAWGWMAVRVAAALMAAGLIAAEVLGVRKLVLGYLRWFVVMQAAIAVATMNGVAGRWNVWRH